MLSSVADLQRRLQDLSCGFVLPSGVEWRVPLHIDGVPPLFDVPDLVGHNDMTPENIIFCQYAPVGIIDFDLAGPTTRLLDVAISLRWWAPLCDPADRDPVLRSLDAGRRMRLFVDAYGLDDGDRQWLLDLAEQRCTRSWHVMRYRAIHDGGGWARMWDEGVGDVILRTKAWLARERPHLEAALKR